MMIFQEVPPPDLINPTGFDFGEIAPGVPTWVPLVAQLIPWIVGMIVDPDADNRQRVLVSGILSAVIAAAAVITGEGGATLGESVTVFMAALLSAQVGYGVAKGLSNGKINELSARKAPPNYEPPYAWPSQAFRQEPPPSWHGPPTEPPWRVPNRSRPESHRFSPTEELPTIRWNPTTEPRYYNDTEAAAATTFNYPSDIPRYRSDAPDTSHVQGRRYL